MFRSPTREDLSARTAATSPRRERWENACRMLPKMPPDDGERFVRRNCTEIAGRPWLSRRLMYASLPVLKVKTKPADSALVIPTTFSPEDMPEMTCSTPDRSFLIKANVAALDIDSQKTTLPLPDMTTTRPGSVADADGDTRHPTGRGSLGFDADGSVNVKVSGDCDVEL